MLWLSPSEQRAIIPLDSSDSWVILNNQQTGFYRVMYDDFLLENISKALQQPNFDGISEMNRAQIVNDLFSFGEGNKTKYSMIFDLLDYLKNEVDFLPWTAAFSAFLDIFNNISVYESVLMYKIRVYLVCLLEKVYTTIPINAPVPDDNQYFAMKQSTVSEWACRLGYPSCLEDARPLFEDYKHGKTINSHVKYGVLCNCVRYAANDSYFKFFVEQYVKSEDDEEQKYIISILTCTQDSDSVQLLLNWTLNNSSVLKAINHGVEIYIDLIFSSPHDLQLTLQFIKQNIEVLVKVYGKEMYDVILNMVDRFPDKKNFDQIEDWKMPQSFDPTFHEKISKILKDSLPRLDWIKLHKDELYNYYDIIADSGN
ncbi:aminopeptidase N-like isoform X2 [Cylas formicarius]|uniref:aminopeptidase N-like isoform X2 n=2 Tax=Cylas formicarius TaxID=197179 RepID=UPI0029584F06|nr:aminopeptidase N-like isoform X2 [Cylas formicarius]